MVHSVDDLKGIHYAVDRNDMHPDTYLYGLHQTWNCESPTCSIDYDTRFHALHLRFKWSQLNPSRGVYNWTELDGFLDEAVLYGKKVTLAVMAGKYTPQWVVDDGAVTVNLEYTGGQFTIPTVILPHDQRYRDAYHVMMKALADHITGNAPYNDAVVLVKAGLAVIHSVEHRIMQPKAYRFPDGIEKDEEDEVARFYLAQRYCDAGYQGDLMIETIRESCDVIRTEFPDQFVGIPFVHGAKRYPSNLTGVFADPNYGRDTLFEALVAVAQDHGNRFVANSTTLNPSVLQSLETLYAAIEAEGSYVAFQTEAAEFGYRNPSQPVNETDLLAAFAEGRRLNGIFVEVHDGNMDPQKDILIAENALLRS